MSETFFQQDTAAATAATKEMPGVDGARIMAGLSGRARPEQIAKKAAATGREIVHKAPRFEIPLANILAAAFEANLLTKEELAELDRLEAKHQELAIRENRWGHDAIRTRVEQAPERYYAELSEAAWREMELLLTTPKEDLIIAAVPLRRIARIAVARWNHNVARPALVPLVKKIIAFLDAEVADYTAAEQNIFRVLAISEHWAPSDVLLALQTTRLRYAKLLLSLRNPGPSDQGFPRSPKSLLGGQDLGNIDQKISELCNDSEKAARSESRGLAVHYP